jgi:hypothetical protein
LPKRLRPIPNSARPVLNNDKVAGSGVVVVVVAAVPVVSKAEYEVVIDPPPSIVAAMAAVLRPNWVVKTPVYGESVAFPESVSRPSVVKVTDVIVPSLVYRKSDPTDVTHDWPAERATLVLQTPLVGDTVPKPVNEKSRKPPARTINVPGEPAGRSSMVPVAPEPSVPPE